MHASVQASTRDGEVKDEVVSRIAKAYRAFGKGPIYKMVFTKRAV